MPQTLDQKRADHAWRVVSTVVAKDEKTRKDFGRQAKKLPSRIMASGLGQALAFLEAKGYAPDLREALNNWMSERRPSTGEPRLVVRVIQQDADFLRYATAECLAYMLWLVRFAEAHKLTTDGDE